MSVPNQTPYNIYTANGLTTVFPYEFYLLNAGDLAVSLNGSVITSGYTISGVGNVDGGEVSFLTPPANGVTIMLERVIPTYRLTDYQDNGDLLADTVNKDFDRLWMAIQQAFIYLGLALTRPLLGGPFNAKGYRIENLGYPVNSSDAANKQYVEDVAVGTLNRTLRVPENYVRVIPAIGSRRRQLLAFDDFGNPITVLPESGSASDVLIVLAGADGADRIGMGQSTVRDVIGYVTPEMFGVPDDGDWTPQITAAVATMREVHLMAGKEYRCDGTIYMPSNNMQRLKFVFNGATIFANHMQPVFRSPAPLESPAISYYHIVGPGKIRSIGSVDTVYEQGKNFVGFPAGDHSSIYNIEMTDISCDGAQFWGYAGHGGDLFFDNVRDNPVVTYGTFNQIGRVNIGHCAGDSLLLKGYYNSIEWGYVKKAGVPGANPEPGFICGGCVIFGAPVDGDPLGGHNRVGYYKAEQWSSLGVGFSGDNCSVGEMELGESIFEDDSPLVQGSKPYVAIYNGNGNHIGRIKSQKSAYGILFIRGERHTLGAAEINNCKKEQLSINVNTKGAKVGDFIVNNSLHAGMYIAPGPGCSIDNVVFNNADIPQGSTACQIRNSNISIGEILINGAGSASGSGVYVEQQAKAPIGKIASDNINGMAMWVRPGGRVPLRAHLANLATATRPLIQVSANQSACSGWYINNRSSSGGQPTVYAEPSAGGAVSTWVGCEGTIPLAQGGATLNAATTSNRFY
ncbi:phage tail fiber protein [Serratia marcescens]|uniref:phage tail fiber domain-containing protein n=1 Tax=Serratia marcescens TaxID=615 RepID=UPI001EFEF176|nr:phage tail fiber protein [Serratia marcescens]